MSDHLSPLESSLGGLIPSAAGLNRDAILFEAGKRAATFRWQWPVMAMLFASLSAVLGMQQMSRPEPQLVVKYVERAAPSPAVIDTPVVEPPQAVPNTMVNGILTRRDQIFRYGLDALPVVPVAVETRSESIEDLKWILRPTH